MYLQREVVMIFYNCKQYVTGLEMSFPFQIKIHRFSFRHCQTSVSSSYRPCHRHPGHCNNVSSHYCAPCCRYTDRLHLSERCHDVEPCRTSRSSRCTAALKQMLSNHQSAAHYAHTPPDQSVTSSPFQEPFCDEVL